MRKRLVAGIVVVGLLAGLSLVLANGMLGSGNASNRGPQQAEQTPAPLAASGAGASEPQPEVQPEPQSEAPAVAAGVAEAAMEQAAKENKYLFAVFWQSEDEQTNSMKQVVSEAVAKMPERAASVAVQVTDPAESAVVEKFGLNRAPMPLVLAIAPSGTVTGGFPRHCNEEDLLDAFVSPAAEQTMKALQDGKLVLLCVQNSSTQQNEEAMRGVDAFLDDPRFGAATTRVLLDPTDGAEASFLSDLQIDPDHEVAQTLMLVPPGSIVASVEGATAKEDFLAALRSGLRGCGPMGCGPR